MASTVQPCSLRLTSFPSCIRGLVTPQMISIDPTRIPSLGEILVTQPKREFLSQFASISSDIFSFASDPRNYRPRLGIIATPRGIGLSHSPTRVRSGGAFLFGNGHVLEAVRICLEAVTPREFCFPRAPSVQCVKVRPPRGPNVLITSHGISRLRFLEPGRPPRFCLRQARVYQADASYSAPAASFSPAKE
jgi:hypothetical protein